jgi:hypothetical protein
MHVSKLGFGQATDLHVANFLECVRTRQTPTAGGADAESVAEARAQDPVESADESSGNVIAVGSGSGMGFSQRVASSNPRWGATQTYPFDSRIYRLPQL